MPRTYKHEEITEWLRTLVESRGPDALLPTIAEVCDRFNVSGVQTVRNAYAPLIEEGLVTRLDSPRRWAVVNHGQEANPTDSTDVNELLDRLRTLLEEAAQVTGQLRLAV